MLEGWDPKLCSVEIYRRGDLERPPYDMSDALDVAIWCALQEYVDYLERLDLERDLEERKVKNLYAYRDTRVLNLRPPGFVESEMLELRAWNRGEKDIDPDELHQVARRVLEAFFAPARSLSGKLVPWGRGEYHVDRVLWEAGEEHLEKSEDGADGSAGLLGVGQWDSPHHITPRLAPLYALLIKSLGGLVSQAEAARRLNLTSRGVALRIERGEMEHIRVGGSVFIPEKDVRVTREERLQARSRSAR